MFNGMVLMFGERGQLAESFRELSWPQGLVTLGSGAADFRHPEALAQILDQHQPRLILNCAAYTQVDRAESDRELALTINARAPAAIGAWAHRAGVPVVHFSTDYVYPGTGDRAYREDDATGPLNTYGESKLMGERLLLESGARVRIFRISWVVSTFGHNFVKTMLRLGAEREALKVVDDQVGSPMSAHAVAKLIHSVLERPEFLEGPAFEVFNLSSPEFVSWCGFAREIFRQARAQGRSLKVSDVAAIPSSEFPTPARRPANSRMDDAKFRSRFGSGLPPWKDSLGELLSRLGP